MWKVDQKWTSVKSVHILLKIICFGPLPQVFEKSGWTKNGFSCSYNYLYSHHWNCVNTMCWSNTCRKCWITYFRQTSFTSAHSLQNCKWCAGLGWYSPWAQRGHRAPPPPPGSSMSGIILFRGPHWSIIEMLTPCKLGRPHLFGHFSKWPPSKSSENWIAHILVFGQPRNTNLVSKPTFSRSLNPMGML